MDTFNALGMFLALCAIGFAMLCLYGMAWLVFGRKEYSEDKTVSAKVLATRYQPHRTHTSLGVVTSADGRVLTTLMVDDEEEEDIVLLRSKETGRMEIDNSDLLDTVIQGEEVELTYKEKYTYWSWNKAGKSLDCYIPVLVKTKNGNEIKL